MEIKAKRWLKIILCGVGLIALLVLSGILGTHIERNRQRALELKKENVSVIAVVNMDNGVMIGNEQINYASQLMAFPNDHFIVTGLTDAKTGIENGIYAAYIVIPETFSTSVTSIENDPRKVMVTYQYNYKLDEETTIQAINDINSFVALLNSNIAYMYIDAIMAEFHRIQDDSSTILANDNMELELLANVNVARLIAVAEPVEEISVDNKIQPVELSTYTSRNSVLLEHLLLSYSEAARKGKDDYAAIQEGSAEIGVAVDNFFLAYDAIFQDTATEQSQLLREGRDKLAEVVGIYNESVNVQETELRNLVENAIDMQLEADRVSAESQLQEIIDNVKDRDNEALKDLQRQWEKTYQDLQSETEKNLEQKSAEYYENLEKLIKDIYMQGYNNALVDLDGQIDSLREDIDSENISISVLQNAINGNMLNEPLAPEVEEYIGNFNAVAKEQLIDISIDWDQLNIKLPIISENESGGEGTEGGEGVGDTELYEGTEGDKEAEANYEISLTACNDEEAISNIVSEALELLKMEAESEEINDVIQTYFVDALSEVNERQISRLSDAKLLLSQSMENYESSLTDYDPLQYIESANLEIYLNDIEVNTEEMLDTVEQNNSEYILYAAEMYTTTTEHTTQVRSSLDEANTQTAENVEGCINDLILSRELVNNQNINLLEGFTHSLKYTRVESQGNAEVYDYIVNPVVSQINGQAVTNAAAPVSKKGNSAKAWLVIVLGIGIIICLMEVIINFRQQYKKPAEKSGDAF